MEMRNVDQDVLYVPEMARKFGKTEAAIRQAVNRGAEWLPRPFKLGTRIAWRVADVDAFLAEQSKQTDGRRRRK